MKGVVFTEFMDMVEEVFSADILDYVIAQSDLPNGGAYTSVGTYDHQEIVRMTANLSQQVNLPIEVLLESFGQHLFARFTQLYPTFFEHTTHVFEFLRNIDSYIHVEVRKLYPEAELPRFYHEQQDDTTLVMYYLSSRHFEDLAIGLIKGCLQFFKTKGEVSQILAVYEGKEAVKITIKLIE
ncbi:MAG: hypothetical protein ACI8Z9_001087 [Paraglaciecola sp.]|jgi:hypothetical protein